MRPTVFDCLVAGDACVDLLMEGSTQLEVGKEKLASEMKLVLGGSSAITAFNLSSLGASVAFASVIGQDSFGRFVTDKLQSASINLRAVRRSDTVKTGITVWHTKKGKRAGMTYPGTIALLELADLPDRVLKSARHLHIGSYFLQTSLHKDAALLFERAHALGLTTSLDTNYDPSERWDSNLTAVLRHTDLFFPNEDEALKITQQRRTADAGRELASMARTVVVKRGEKGAIVATGDKIFEVPAIPTKLVDTTGAGDSFNAGFLAKFLRGAKLEVCAKAGIIAGSRCVQAVGGTAAFEGVASHASRKR